MEEYLTLDELSARIKFSKQSLYNLIYKRTFILGKHYLKPTPKKILFKWSEIKIWMGEPLYRDDITVSDNIEKKKYSTQDKPQSSINI